MEKPHFHVEVVVGVTDISMLVTLNTVASVVLILWICIVSKLATEALYEWERATVVVSLP